MDAEDDVAVIGIGCNFPGGEGLDNFWRVLSEGENCVVDIPAERFDKDSWYDPDDSKPGKMQTTKAALIDGLNEFDHNFFGIAEAEADVMDPQHKLLLQCTFRALEDAGVPMEGISGSRTGVYIGLMNRDFEMLLSNSPASISHYNATGTAMSLAANRISFVFNLTGPSFALDSACSSSLVALHVACQAIRQGDCEMALCGGVNCILEPRVFVALSKARMISPEGTSKPFSNRADGYGRGEGCGVVLLRPLKNALQDCNKIWGIIAKTAVNQDGHSVSPITKPSLNQQKELLHQIYSECDLADVQYIEAHGTGTPVGDLTEATSIANVLSQSRHGSIDSLRIGSVKGNIGHTESAAGMAGLIKVLLMMKYQTIVPSVFYSQDRSGIDVEVMRISIPTKAEKWGSNGLWKRVAGINSFGFGGTNAHVIVREFKQTTHLAQIPKDGPSLFVTSAASEKSLIRCLTDIHKRLLDGQTADAQALCYTSACGRSHAKHKYRRAIVMSSLDDLQHRLASSLKAKVASTKSNAAVVFVFSGNGVAFKGMCGQLFSTIPLFKDKVREVEVLFQKRNQHIRISQWLSGERDMNALGQPDVVQPLLFALQVAIAALLKHWGIKPDTVLGHSLGEVAAAHCSGLLCLEDAVKVVYHRSVLQSRATVGKMLVVGNILVEKVLRILQDFSENVCVAAFNSPEFCTLSGDEETVEVLRDKLTRMYVDENIFLHILDVPAAYHSHLMDPILEDIQSNLDCLAVNNMECKLFSTVTGEKYACGDFVTGSYWAKNIREPVLFERALHAVTRDKQSRRSVVFVEIGPRRALQRHIHETLGKDVIVLPSVEPQKEHQTILSTVGKLFELGVNMHWQEFYQGYKTPPTVFPVYHFDSTKKEMNFEDVRQGYDWSSSPHLLISQIRENNNEYVCNLTVETAPYLLEHKHNGIAIVPGAFYVELAFASAVAHLKPKRPISFIQLSVAFHNLLITDNHQLKVRLEETSGVFTINSPAATHASGTFKCTDGPAVFEEPNICPEGIFKRCSLIVTTTEFYSILSRAGFDYGPVFKQLDNVHFGDEFKEAVTAIHVPKELLKHLHDFFIHPVLLDYFLQMTAVGAMRRLSVKQGFPSAIGSIVISGPPQEEMFIYMRATEEKPDFLKLCGCFAAKDGKVLVELQEVRITFLGGGLPAPQSVFFHNEIVPITSKINVDRKIRALVFSDKLGIAEALGPYLDPESSFVKDRNHWTPGQLRDFLGNSMRDVVFIWAAEDLSHLSADRTLDCLVACCESFRQVILTLKESQHSCTVRVITYRSTEMIVDYVSSGFVLSGMMRACAAEVPGIFFQLIDLMSLTGTDIESLVGVINSCTQSEVIVGHGQVSIPWLTRTHVADKVSFTGDIQSVRGFILQTSHPYRVEGLTACPNDTNDSSVVDKSVEVQLTNICVHSSDYFPVTLSHLDFGETLYWNNCTAHHHTLLALDYSGIVTAVGKDVCSLKVGDRITTSYPSASATRVVIPESVCYDTKKLPFLEECPSVSFFILAWELLQRTLPTVKPQQQNKLAIITPDLASVLLKVLALTANRSGWNVSCLPHLSKQKMSPDPFRAFVFLPPYDDSWQDLNEDDGHERHAVFVCGTYQSSPRWKNGFAFKSHFFHVHVLHVTRVLQRVYLKAQGASILKWLTTLGFDRASLPVKRDTFQISSTAKAPADESYFVSKTVRQVVLDQRTPNCQLSDIVLLSKPRQLFKKHCTYIVTGGLTGLGLETVKFIACNGGGCIVTLSRRMPTRETHSELDLIQKRYNITIVNFQCDVSVLQEVVEAISKTEMSCCPIKGIFHSAAVLHDAPIEILNASLLQKVLQPKVSGALNLHNATLHKKLDFFVCYSSISSLLGNESQSNYAAANSFLDTFCLYRRNLGLAGQSINWGPLNLGLLFNKKHVQKHLESKGLMVMDVGEIHEALAKVLLTNRPQQLVCKFNFKNASLRERLSALAEVELKDSGSIEPPVRQSSSPHESVRRIIGDIRNLAEDELDDNATLDSLGVDSMLAMTLQNKIFQETSVTIPLVRLLDPNMTVVALESFVTNNNVMRN
uniref:Phthiocerol/phenolphthiocerol synthesis polyketide synthase type I PpsD-like n=1 Tax=Hippocampus comes TaxID=109280 RepID=A0A3Q2YXV4_HIPCM